MTYDRFNQLVSLMLQYGSEIKSVYQPIDNEKKKEDMIIVVVYDTSSIELEELIKAGFGFSIFPTYPYGNIELWCYDLNE